MERGHSGKNRRKASNTKNTTVVTGYDSNCLPKLGTAALVLLARVGPGWACAHVRDQQGAGEAAVPEGVSPWPDVSLEGASHWPSAADVSTSSHTTVWQPDQGLLDSATHSDWVKQMLPSSGHDCLEPYFPQAPDCPVNPTSYFKFPSPHNEQLT